MMFGLSTMMNTGWQLVQSTLSTIGGVLFSKSPQSKTKRRPIGLDQLVLTKAYWVDIQREVFTELKEADELTPEAFQLALDELLGHLGARIGSPAVMLLELEQLSKKVTDSALIDVLRDAKASIQASLIKDPSLAYANFMADVQLLCEDTSMQFINSSEGRAWLEAYRPFFNDVVFEQALSTIVDDANAQIGELYCNVTARGLSTEQIAIEMDQAQDQIDRFNDWIGQLHDKPRQPTEPKVRKIMRSCEAEEQAEDSKQEVSKLAASTSRQIVSSIIRILKSPITLLTKYPKFTGGLLLATRATAAIAQAVQGQRVYPQTRDVSDVFRSMPFNQDEFDGTSEHAFFSRDVGKEYRARNLQQASEECIAGIKQQGWMQTLGGPNNDDYGYGVAMGEQGQIVVVGYTGSYGAGERDVLLAQINPEGNLQWAQTLGGSEFDVGYDVSIGSQGQIVLVGYTESYGEGDKDVFLAQYSPDGNLEWARTLGGVQDEIGIAMAIGYQGQIVVIGYTSSFTGGVDRDVLLAQVSTEGNLQWAQTFGGVNNDEAGGVAIDAEGKIVVVGTTNSYGEGRKNLLFSQFSAVGSFEWAQALDEPETYGRGIAIGPQGQFVVVGRTHGYGADSWDVFLAQYSAGWQLEWAQRLGGPASEDIRKITLGPLGQIVVVGNTWSYGAGEYDALLAQYSAQGELQWMQTLGGRNRDYGSGVAIGPLGQIVVVGGSGSFGHGREDVLLVQFDSDGKLENLSFRVELHNISNLVNVQDIEPITNQTSWTPKIVTDTIEIAPQTQFSPDPIAHGDVSVYSLMINHTVIEGVEGPVLTEEFVLPLGDLFISASSVLAVDLTKADWLTYDEQNKQLIGTPLLNSLRQVEISITLQLNHGAGIAAGDLILCVNEPGSFIGDSVRLGGVGHDNATAIEVGPDDQVVVVGYTASYDASGYDVLLAQVSAEGRLAWAQTLGGASQDVGMGVTVGQQNQIVLVGYTRSYGAGGDDVLLAQVSAEGHLVWVQAMGGLHGDIGRGVAIGTQGQIVVVGSTNSYGAGGDDVLLVQVSASGNMTWALTLGGVDEDAGMGIAVGLQDQIVVVGEMRSFGAGGQDVFLAQLSAEGDLVWAQTLGGSGFDSGYDVAIGPQNQIVVVGETRSYGAGGQDVFLVQVSPEGSVEWAQTLGGSNWEYGSGVAIGLLGQIVVVGETRSYGAGGRDVLLVQVSPEGSLMRAQALGGLGSDSGYGVATGSQGQISIAGVMESFVDVPDTDMLIVKFDSQGNHTTSQAGFYLHELTEISSLTSSPVVNSITDILANPGLGMDIINFDELKSNLTFLPPTHTLTYSNYFEINFRIYLQGFKNIFSVTANNAFSLPAWLHVDRVNLVLSGTPTGSVRGPYVIRMDAEIANGRKWVSFLLDVLNTPPSFTHSAAFESTVGRFVLPIGSYFADAERDAIGSFAIAKINGTQAAPIASIDPDTGRFFGTTISGDQGQYQFNITAADPYGGVGWQVITLDVLNTPPVQDYPFSDPSPVTIGGSPFYYDFPSNAFVDPDGDVVTYEVVLPEFLSFNIAGRVIQGSPAVRDRGIHEVQIVGKDSYGGSSSVSTLINVNAVPVLSSPLFVGVDDQIQATPVGVAFSSAIPGDLFTDPDGDDLVYLLTEDIQHIVPSWLTFDSVTRTLSGIPDANPHQAQPLRFEVVDGRGGSAFFELSLVIPNSAPHVVAGVSSQTLLVNELRSTLIPTDAFDDPDDDSLTYSLAGSAGNLNWINLAGNVLTMAPRSGNQGSYQFQLFASDAYGGQVETSFSVTVPNRPPQLAYDIPEPSLARAQDYWSFVLDSDNFEDPDQDPLSYHASQEDGQDLPAWLHFSSVRRIFSGSPTGQDRGTYPIRVWAEDVVGARAEGPFNLTVANSAPQVLRPLTRKFVDPRKAEDSFDIGEVVDPDGDKVVYDASMENGEPLPDWIVFDPLTREFRVFPRRAPASRDYSILITTTDSEGMPTEQVLDLTVQAPPDSTEENQWAQYMWTGIGSASGLAIIIMTVLWRANRIKTTNSNLKTLASKYRTDLSLAKTDAEMNALMGELINRVRTLEPGGETALIHLSQRFSEALSAFASVHVKPGLVSRLKIGDLFNQFCDMLISILASKQLGESERFNRVTHAMIYALGLIMDGVTMAIAQQGNLVLEDFERSWIERIDVIKGLVESALLGTELRGIGLCGKRKASLRRVHTVYALNALREATVYLPDTSTLLGLLKESLLHVVAPAKLLSDFRFIVTNVPSKWYMAILNAKLQTRALIKVENEDDQLCALRNMQYALTEAMRETFIGVRFKPDWRLCYGALNLFVEMLKHDELPVKAKLQVLTGKTPNGELLIGLESFTSYSHWLQKARARWIREAAIDGLGQLANIPTLWGDALLKSVLTPYRHKRVSRAVSIYAVDGIGSERRFSRVKRLAMPSQEAKPTASSQFSVANPLAARAPASKPRQAVPVQTVRRSAGAVSAPSSSTP